MANLNKIDLVNIDLNANGIFRSFLNKAIGLNDNQADSFGVRVFRDGEPVDLTGAWVQGFFRNPRGENIALTEHGTFSGNAAYVTLPQACYNYEGQFTLAIKIVSPGSANTVTMRIVDGVVDNTNVGGAVAPTSTVPTYQEVLAVYDDMVAATTAATTAATNVGSIVAAAYSTSATYAVGDYCTKDGNLYRCTTAITTAESWTAAHWTQTKMGSDVSDLKSAFDELTDSVETITDLVATTESHETTTTETITPTWAQGYTSPDGSVGSSTTLYYCTPINVSEGDVIQPTRGDGGLIASVYYLTAYYNNSAVSALGGSNVDMPYTVPSGVDQIVLTIASAYMSYGNPKIKHTYTVTVQTYEPKFVSLDGNGEVVAQNIDGMEEIGTLVSNNLFSTATLIESGKYIAGINGSGKVYFYTNESYDTYIIPVDGKSIYTFTDVRFGCVVSDLEYTAVGSILSNVKQINSSGGSYILFSFAPASYPTETFIITKPVTYYKIPQNWILGESKKHTDSESDAIASGGTLDIIGRTALKDGETISFKGFFETFSGFSLNFVATDITNFITVTTSTITIKSTSTVPTAVNHGLTIRNYVSLDCQFISGKLKVTLYSNDDSYTTTVDWFQLNGQVTQPQIVSNGTVFSSATLSIAYEAVKRDVWYFGDSYIGVIDPARWPYYLAEDGFIQNILLNGSSGGSSGGAIISFITLLKYGTPKFAVLGTGMNDGSDSSSAPPTSYVTRRTEFLKLCEVNGIEPIFCTIPTVPSINNEQKNAWVRSSGYRYIDFAKAVGADGTGAWFEGMLSSDNVHPTGKGARALYTQVLIDLPEVTVK